MSDLPAPLIDPDVDLRDFDYMPFEGDRLFKSETWILCDAEEKVAALRLWWASWHEEPAGSLPDNDRLLAELAGYGVAVSAWLKVKENAMRNWERCSDGRLYHPVVCRIALESWAKKRKKQADNAAERARKARKRGNVPQDRAAATQPGPADNTNTHIYVSGGNDENSGGQSKLSGGHDNQNGAQSDGFPAENALKGEGRELEGNTPPTPPGGKSARSDGKSRRKPETPLAADWVCPEDWIAQESAKFPGLDVRRQADRFKNHAHQNDRRCRDWRAAFRNWIDGTAEKQGISRAGTKPATPAQAVDDFTFGERCRLMARAGYAQSEIVSMGLDTMPEPEFQAKLAVKRPAPARPGNGSARSLSPEMNAKPPAGAPPDEDPLDIPPMFRRTEPEAVE